MKTLKLIIIIQTAITFLLLGVIFATLYYQPRVKAYHNYYKKTEAMLDTLYSQNDIYFQDYLMETDTYFNYESSRDKLIDRDYEIANYKHTK